MLDWLPFFKNRPERRISIAEESPNGDLLLEFISRDAWHELCARCDGDLEVLEDVLRAAMVVWDTCVLRAMGSDKAEELARPCAEERPRFFALYSQRKDDLFAGDRRIFLDVRVSRLPDGEIQVDAIASFALAEGELPPHHAREMLLFPSPRRPRTPTERNRMKRLRRQS